MHVEGRSDIFKVGRKYNDAEIENILKDENKRILVAVNKDDEVIGYSFCIFVKHENDSVLTNIKSLYIDDLCVDEKYQRQGIGRALFEESLELAKKEGCYNLTLNVWSCNKEAIKFYEEMGLTPQKIGMEIIIE